MLHTSKDRIRDDVAAAASHRRVVRSVLFLRISTVPEKRKLTLDNVTLRLHLTVRDGGWWLERFMRHGWRHARLDGYPNSSKITACLLLSR